MKTKMVAGMLSFGLLSSLAVAQVVERERPAEWKNLVPGGQFQDFILPIPVREGYTSDTWGGDNVKPRDITNGIEDPEWTYWCGDPIKDENGLYHLFSTRWREDHPKGHFGYFDSEIGRATSTDPMGPYIWREKLGEGHNSDIYKSKQGNYIVYSVHGRYFISQKGLAGPWKRCTYDFHKRERYVFPGYVNFSFAQRNDESYIAVSRRGYIWASPDGEENWYNTSGESVYPKVPGIFEDPVIWKDDIQYHIIVNDWMGRIAYYLRSKDGFHWVTEPGEAYAPGLCKYDDGNASAWYKYERIRFLQDDQGRPSHVHFAVTDIKKHDDLQSDNHNGKLIILPMRKARLLDMLNDKPLTATTPEIRIKVKAEDGFNPHVDLDLESLRFGAASEVNYGRGATFLRKEAAGKDLILVFDGRGSGFTAENFAGKLLGKDAAGELLFGWSSLPSMTNQVSMLSPLSPRFEFTPNGLCAYIEIQNFGELTSKKAEVRLERDGVLLAEGTVRCLKPFETSIVRLVCSEQLKPGAKHEFTVRVTGGHVPEEFFTKTVTLPQD